MDSKCFKDLNVRSEMLKLLEKNMETLEDVGIGNDFLNNTSVVQEIIPTIDKWDYIIL
jgi:hypothetical protein